MTNLRFQSSVREMGAALAFPQYTGERVYMRPFRKEDGVPVDLFRWQPLVDEMLVGVETDETLYLMIDQSPVPAGSAQRRRGLHIDGYWCGNGWGHRSGLGGHGARLPRHGTIPPRPSGGHGPGRRHMSGADEWAYATFDEPEAIILASDVAASRGYVGAFDGPIGEAGDSSQITSVDLVERPLVSHRVYAGNVTFLHESLPVAHDALRTLVRINAPGWHP